MKKYWIIQRIIAIALIVVLFAPIALAGGGGKQFKKGRKFEAAQQWDLAAEQYALALSEDPSNPEYKLHFLRSLANASLSFMGRGKVLAEQGDYEGAYQAFRQAYSYDNTNEMALSRMKSMLEKLGIDRDKADSSPSDLKKTSLESSATANKDVALSTTKFRKSDFDFSTEASVMQIINVLASQAGLNIVYEDNIAKLVETKKARFTLKNVSAPKALDIFFNTQRLSYAQLDRRTILVFTDALANRQKYEDLYVRTFYIKNSVLEEASMVLQQAVGSKQIIKIKNLNALVVRDTKDNLALIETLLERVDKAQSEVVLDVNLYEVSDRNMLQIGNQFDTGILGALGSFAGDGSARRSTLPGAFTDLATGIVAPSSTFSFLQSKSIGKLIASTQIRAFENEAGSVNIGSRVPITTATIPTGNVVTTGLGQNGQGTQSQSVLGGIGGVQQIQYVDVGLNLELTPQVLNEYVQMKLSIESSNVLQESQTSRRNQNNPTFTQRKVKGVARIKEGETGIVASVMRIDKSEGASGIPFLSFIPIAGRLFATPKNDSMSTNIVITITPHVLRAPYVSESDLKTIGPNGNSLSFGVNLTLEEIIARANYEDQLENSNGVTTPQVNQQSSTPTPNPNQTFPGVIAPTNNKPVNNINNNQVIPANTPKPNQPPSPLPNPLPAPPTESSSTGNPNADPNASEENLANLSPVTVLARVLNSQIAVGQIGLVGLVLSSNNIKVSEANLSLRFNPSIVKVKDVKDGGLMSLNGTPAEFNFSEVGDAIIINVKRPVNAAPVNAFGQVALVYFEGIAPGSADLNLSEAQLLGPNAQSIPITLVNGNIEVQKAQSNGGNGGNGDNGDDEDDEEDE